MLLRQFGLMVLFVSTSNILSCHGVGTPTGYLNSCMHVAYSLLTILSRAISGPKCKIQLLVKYDACCITYSIVLY